MWCLWSAKGGVGCSVTAAALGVVSSRRRDTVVVDLGGDLPLVLGVDEGRRSAGIAEWLAADDPPTDALGRLELPVRDRLSLLPAGQLPLTGRPERCRELVATLAADDRHVIVDVGANRPRLVALFDAEAVSVLVTRCCYLALSRAPVGHPDLVVAIREPGRVLRPADVGRAVGAPVLAVLDHDPSVARVVDAGILPRRLPSSLRRLDQVLAAAPERPTRGLDR